MAAVHAKIRTALKGSDRRVAEAVCAVIRVTDDGKLVNGTAPLIEGMQQPDGEELPKQCMSLNERVAAAFNHQGGVDMAVKGCTSKEFRQLLITEGGLEPTQAWGLLKGIHKEMQVGAKQVWSARNRARRAVVTGTKEAFEKDLETLVAAAEARGSTQDIRGYVMGLTAKQQKRWMQLERDNQTTMHEYGVQRTRVAAQKTRMATKEPRRRNRKRMRQAVLVGTEGRLSVEGRLPQAGAQKRKGGTGDESAAVGSDDERTIGDMIGAQTSRLQAQRGEPPGDGGAGTAVSEAEELTDEDYGEGDVPLGQLARFRQVHAETGAEYIILEGTEYMAGHKATQKRRRSRPEGGTVEDTSRKRTNQAERGHAGERRGCEGRQERVSRGVKRQAEETLERDGAETLGQSSMRRVG